MRNAPPARRPSRRALSGLAAAGAALLVIVATTRPAAAGVEDWELGYPYRQLRTDDLRLVFYDSDHLFLSPHVVRCYRNSLAAHRRLFDWTPSEETTVFLNDGDDYGYAGSTALPWNYLTLGVEPFESVYETCPTNERVNWVMSHELVHVVASDQQAGADRLFRRLFRGKLTPTPEDPVSILFSYLCSPRRYAPRWYHEGLAVFFETWLAGGIGRSLGGYDEMTFRAMVREGEPFYDIVGLESEGTAIDFQVGQNSYLYGTRFMSWLGARYGPERVLAWARRDEGSRAYFASQFAHVFGRPLGDAWGEWIADEHAWQRANLDSIRAYPVTEGTDLAGRAFGSVSRPWLDARRGQLYVAVNYPGDFAHVAALDLRTGRARKLCEVPTAALYYVCHLAWDGGDTLFFTTDNARRWRDLNAVDVRTGRARTLLKDCRIGDLAFSAPDRALWGVQHHGGLSRIVRVPQPWTGWQELLTLPYARDLFDVDVSPDGRWLTGTMTDATGAQRLVRFDTATLRAGGADYAVLWEFADNMAGNFTWTPDGRYLLGTSYQTGVSNVFRFDTVTGLMECLTNAETGFFRPIAAGPDSLVAFRYTADGFRPARLATRPLTDVKAIRYLGQEVASRHPVVRDWVLPPPSRVQVDSSAFVPRPYARFASLRTAGLYPIGEAYKDRPAWGLRWELMDPAVLNSLDLAATWSPGTSLPSRERLHLRGKYRRYPWTLSAAWNRADFYDFFGPTKTSRKGLGARLEYEHPLLNEPPRALDLNLAVAGYADMDRLPAYQNVPVTYDRFLTGSASLAFKALRRPIGGVEPEKGLAWGLGADASLVKGEAFPQVWGTLDAGWLLPPDHLSLWLRLAGGRAWGDRDSPFASYYFGGFGNNWVDHREANRYRSFDSFPGLEINEVPGRTFGRAMAELMLPPLRFRQAGWPGAYANWARLSLFTTLLAADPGGDAPRRELLDWGAQVNVRMVLFSALESTLSLGWAQALEEGRRPVDETMVSLKILR